MSATEDKAVDDLEAAFAAGEEFVRPKLLDILHEKGAVGVWSQGFRTGWTAARRPSPATQREPSEKAAEDARVHEHDRAESAEAEAAKLRERVAELEGAIEFYADPDSYVALVIWGDAPCGEFIRDFDADYDHETYPYERPMPGSRARAALRTREGR